MYGRKPCTSWGGAWLILTGPLTFIRTLTQNPKITSGVFLGLAEIGPFRYSTTKYPLCRQDCKTSTTKVSGRCTHILRLRRNGAWPNIGQGARNMRMGDSGSLFGGESFVEGGHSQPLLTP